MPLNPGIDPVAGGRPMSHKHDDDDAAVDTVPGPLVEEADGIPSLLRRLMPGTVVEGGYDTIIILEPAWLASTPR